MRGKCIDKSFSANVPQLELTILKTNYNFIEICSWMTHKSDWTILKELKRVNNFPQFCVNDLDMVQKSGEESLEWKLP